MKKIILLTLCLALAASMAGCLQAANPNPPAAQIAPGTPLAPPVAAPPPPGQSVSGPLTAFAGGDANIAIDVIMHDEPYSVSDFIQIYVQIGNIGDKTLAFVHGSGSKTVPDALRVDLGGLFGVYNPAIMTMDYQVRKLEPGEVLEFELGFAPFVPNVEFPMPPHGPELDFFSNNDEFIPAAPGVLNGTVSFRFAEMEDPDEFGAMFLLGEDDFAELVVPVSVVLV